MIGFPQILQIGGRLSDSTAVGSCFSDIRDPDPQVSAFELQEETIPSPIDSRSESPPRGAKPVVEDQNLAYPELVEDQDSSDPEQKLEQKSAASQ